jgi:hypothetical protein
MVEVFMRVVVMIHVCGSQKSLIRSQIGWRSQNYGSSELAGQDKKIEESLKPRLCGVE